MSSMLTAKSIRSIVHAGFDAVIQQYWSDVNLEEIDGSWTYARAEQQLKVTELKPIFIDVFDRILDGYSGVKNFEPHLGTLNDEAFLLFSNEVRDKLAPEHRETFDKILTDLKHNIIEWLRREASREAAQSEAVDLGHGEPRK